MTTQKTMRKTRTPAGSAAIKTKKIERRVKLPPNPFIHEILNHVEEQKTKAKKIAALKEYRDDSLTAILIWNFDDSVVSAVPEGQVPYKENEVPVGTDHIVTADGEQRIALSLQARSYPITTILALKHAEQSYSQSFSHKQLECRESAWKWFRRYLPDKAQTRRKMDRRTW